MMRLRRAEVGGGARGVRRSLQGVGKRAPSINAGRRRSRISCFARICSGASSRTTWFEQYDSRSRRRLPRHRAGGGRSARPLRAHPEGLPGLALRADAHWPRARSALQREVRLPRRARRIREVLKYKQSELYGLALSRAACASGVSQHGRSGEALRQRLRSDDAQGTRRACAAEALDGSRAKRSNTWSRSSRGRAQHGAGRVRVLTKDRRRQVRRQRGARPRRDVLRSSALRARIEAYELAL